jgi:RNA polymerase sigma-70 factor, ECF subfamily
MALAGIWKRQPEDNQPWEAQMDHVSSFGEISERCRARLMGVAYRILRNQCDAQDAVQDSLLRAFVNLGKFREQSAFLTWATRITINSCLMKLRSRQTHLEQYPAPGILGEKYLEIAGATPHPEEIVLKQEQEQFLKAAIGALPKKLKEVVELKELRELTLEEVASALGTSVGATKARLFRAKSELKKRLEVRRKQAQGGDRGTALSRHRISAPGVWPHHLHRQGRVLPATPRKRVMSVA